jgi:hypothetical protein
MITLLLHLLRLLPFLFGGHRHLTGGWGILDDRAWENWVTVDTLA